MSITKIKLDVKYKIKKIKWFFQRGKNGYADIDCFNINFYLLNILPKMLDKLSCNYFGVPSVHWSFWNKRGYSDSEINQMWGETLKYIKWNLEEAGEETCSLINPYQDAMERKIKGEQVSEELNIKWMDFEFYITQYRHDHLITAMQLIQEYFWELWD